MVGMLANPVSYASIRDKAAGNVVLITVSGLLKNDIVSKASGNVENIDVSRLFPKYSDVNPYGKASGIDVIKLLDTSKYDMVSGNPEIDVK
jgi:hypothetical protein